mgnify:CR=1 FL=1
MPAIIHVDIFVSCLQQSIDFYTRFFDARVVDRAESVGPIPEYYSAGKSDKCSMAILKFSMLGATLELMQLHGLADLPHPVTGSISFHVNSLDDFRHELLQKGARIDSENFEVTLESGMRSRLFFMLDPDGHRLEFVESSKPRH